MYNSCLHTSYVLTRIPNSTEHGSDKNNIFITLHKFGISQSDALFTVLISYDIKSLTCYPAIPWAVCKMCTLLLALEMKIATEKEGNERLVR